MLQYGTVPGEYHDSIANFYTDAGVYTTYYCISAPHYETITGSADVVIEKANREIQNLPLQPDLIEGESEQLDYAVNKDADGSAAAAISFSSSDSTVASVDGKGRITAYRAGTSDIFVSLKETKNYLSSSLKK